jgi:hypothetical protein
MNDAKFWKHELFRELGRQRELEEDAGDELASRQVQVERFVFVTAYMMRKLHEAAALTEDVTKSRWSVTKYPCIAPPPHRHWFRLWETPGGRSWQPIQSHYDLNAPTPDHLPFGKLCNYLIHHFGFALRASENGSVEMLFNSDYTKDECLFAMSLDDFKRVVEEVACDEVRWVDMDRSRGRVIQRRGRPHDG